MFTGNQNENGRSRQPRAGASIAAPPSWKARATFEDSGAKLKLNRDYLSLRLTSLSPADEWVHEREGLLFVFPKDGAGKCISAHLLHELSPGDVLVMNAPPRGTLKPANGKKITFWFFSLRLEHLFPLFSTHELCLLPSVTNAFKGAKVYTSFTRVAAECHSLLDNMSPRFDLVHRGQLMRVASCVLSEEFNHAQPHSYGFVGSEEHGQFENLSADELLELPVGALADKFNCSRRHLTRLFHQRFGCSVAALKMEVRLLKAVTLLRDPAAKVTNVAEQCGFNHLGHHLTIFIIRDEP